MFYFATLPWKEEKREENVQEPEPDATENAKLVLRRAMDSRYMVGVEMNDQAIDIPSIQMVAEEKDF